ncbi:hypothetical protein [Legionella yabuuchiae]|uniref:hypothetical protein n=1 Tax=Legionella yabuuchiae TaxID=376727 RepID=UPI001056AEAD|nr:hypothetical protein [Legionella yabuuchiae]
MRAATAAEEERISSSFLFEGIQSIPKAECNVLIGAAISFGASFISGPLGWGIAVVATVNYALEKPQQDNLVKQYYNEVAPYGWRDGSGIIKYHEARMQKYIKGFTHPFFRQPEEIPNENSGVIYNAAGLRIFCD